jgi:hypothetical protein
LRYFKVGVVELVDELESEDKLKKGDLLDLMVTGRPMY